MLLLVIKMSKTIDWYPDHEWEVMFYRNWKFVLVPMLMDYEPEDWEYRIYISNPNLYFDTEAEAPEDFKSIEDAKAWVSGFINENF